ncbi:MAG: TIM barrel protein [Rhodanobacter sp.]
MKHKYSLAHLSALMLPPPDLIDAAAQAGYEYVGLRVNRVTTDEPLYSLVDDVRLMRETKAHLSGTGVQVLDIELARIGPNQNARDLLPLLEVAAELGAHDVIGQLPDPDRDRSAEQFAILCDLARPLGIFVNLEFPSWTATPGLGDAVSIVRKVDRPNAAILVDMLHFSRSHSVLDELDKLPKTWFRYAHLCDAPAARPATKEGLIHEARSERLFPGEGGLGVAEILAHLPADIPYALEIPRLSLARILGDVEYVRLALDATRRYVDGEPAHATQAETRRQTLA